MGCRRLSTSKLDAASRKDYDARHGRVGSCRMMVAADLPRTVQRRAAGRAGDQRRVTAEVHVTPQESCSYASFETNLGSRRPSPQTPRGIRLPAPVPQPIHTAHAPPSAAHAACTSRVPVRARGFTACPQVNPSPVPWDVRVCVCLCMCVCVCVCRLRSDTKDFNEWPISRQPMRSSPALTFQSRVTSIQGPSSPQIESVAPLAPARGCALGDRCREIWDRR